MLYSPVYLPVAFQHLSGLKKKCILIVQDNICSCPLICPPDVPLPTTDYPSGFLADLTEVLV